MPILEQRVTTLEKRVDNLEERCGDVARATVTALDAHRHNTSLLNALRTTQAEHSNTLSEHSRKLDEHTAMFGKLMVGMHRIERSINHLIARDANGPADGA